MIFLNITENSEQSKIDFLYQEFKKQAACQGVRYDWYCAVIKNKKMDLEWKELKLKDEYTEKRWNLIKTCNDFGGHAVKDTNCR